MYVFSRQHTLIGPIDQSLFSVQQSTVITILNVLATIDYFRLWSLLMHSLFFTTWKHNFHWFSCHPVVKFTLLFSWASVTLLGKPKLILHWCTFHGRHNPCWRLLPCPGLTSLLYMEHYVIDLAGTHFISTAQINVSKQTAIICYMWNAACVPSQFFPG